MEAAENFNYSSSIDDATYNKIKLAFNNEKTGKRELYVAQVNRKSVAIRFNKSDAFNPSSVIVSLFFRYRNWS
mgnify:CR=1 FL=1